MQSNLLKTKTLADNSRRTDSGFRVRMTSDLRYFRVIKREIGSHFHWVATRTAVGKRSPERDLELSHICGAKRTCDELSVLLVSGAVPGTCGKWPILRGNGCSLIRQYRPPLETGRASWTFLGDFLGVSDGPCAFG